MIKEVLIDALRVAPSEKLVELWNEYCDTNHYEGHIYCNDIGFIESAFTGDVIKALKATAEHYVYENPYAWWDNFAELHSCEDPLDEGPIELWDLAIWLIGRYSDEELVEMLNMFEETDEYEDE